MYFSFNRSVTEKYAESLMEFLFIPLGTYAYDVCIGGGEGWGAHQKEEMM